MRRKSQWPAQGPTAREDLVHPVHVLGNKEENVQSAYDPTSRGQSRWIVRVSSLLRFVPTAMSPASPPPAGGPLSRVFSSRLLFAPPSSFCEKRRTPQHSLCVLSSSSSPPFRLTAEGAPATAGGPTCDLEGWRGHVSSWLWGRRATRWQCGSQSRTGHSPHSACDSAPLCEGAWEQRPGQEPAAGPRGGTPSQLGKALASC